MALDEIKEKQKLSWEGMFYSIQRLDLLIISICGAGIYICLETIKYLSEKELSIPYYLKFSGVFFTISIIINIASQWCGFKANEQDFLMYEVEIDSKHKPKRKKALKKSYDQRADNFSATTNILNIISIILMFGGLVSVMSYFILTF